LLDAAGKNPEILILVETSRPDLLPILPKVVELAPTAVLLLVSVINLKVGPGALQAGAFGRLIVGAVQI
jgi:hypothetical protein